MVLMSKATGISKVKKIYLKIDLCMCQNLEEWVQKLIQKII